ncbi:MAG: hypothetical protein ABSH48_03650 [Verrucomicrobiota bacterium]|jgi:hypothetical protein
MKTRLKSAAIVLLLSIITAPLATARAQTMAFTYQGALNDSGAPANGSYDLSFAAYDAAAGGNLISAIVTNSAVTVSNGLFTTTVDFGNDVFTGGDLWLEIGVSTNGANTFATIAPRQQLTPTPYALYSQTAGTAASAAPGAFVTSLNTLKDDITLAAGTNVTITPSGNTLTISSAGAGGSGIWSVNGNNAFYTAGSVGIGTTNPIGALQLAGGGLAVTGASSPYTGAGAGIFMENSSLYGGVLFAFDYGLSTPQNLLLNSPGGNVGIGTLSPQAKLHIYDPANSVTDLIETGGGVNSWARISFKDADGQWDVGTSQNFNGDQLYFYREGATANAFAIQPNGNAAFAGSLGVGTLSPQFELDVNGITHAGAGLAVTGASSPNYPNTEGVYIEKGDYSTGGSYGAVYAYNYNNPSPHAMSLCLNTPGGFVGIGTISPAYPLDVNGTTRTHSIIITGGSDLAEPFKLGEAEIAKGSVVVIDKEHPGALKLSSIAYDKTVAGIVSGANGINPGIALHQEGVLEGGQNIALSGRVYVQADASNGAIEPGDLLTTSSTPGSAMKVTDFSRAQGAILGKAMTALDQGNGMVLVLVSLQ